MDTVAVLARRNLSGHDPSTLVRCGKYWYGFATGPGIPAFRSRDLIRYLLYYCVGRGKNADGPFLDQMGGDLQKGGGSLFLAGDGGAFIGPGHAGIVADGRKEYLSCHFYDGDKNGLPTLGILPLTWSKNGWPEIATPAAPPTLISK